MLITQNRTAAECIVAHNKVEKIRRAKITSLYKKSEENVTLPRNRLTKVSVLSAVAEKLEDQIIQLEEYNNSNSYST